MKQLLLLFYLLYAFQIVGYSKDPLVIVNRNENNNGTLYHKVYNVIVIPNSIIDTTTISRIDFELLVQNDRCINIMVKNEKVSHLTIWFSIDGRRHKKKIKIRNSSYFPKPVLIFCAQHAPPESNPCSEKFSIGSINISSSFLPDKNDKLLNYEVMNYKAKLFRNNICIDSIKSDGFYPSVNTNNNFGNHFENMKVNDTIKYINFVVQDNFGNRYSFGIPSIVVKKLDGDLSHTYKHFNYEW